MKVVLKSQEPYACRVIIINYSNLLKQNSPGKDESGLGLFCFFKVLLLLTWLSHLKGLW